MSIKKNNNKLQDGTYYFYDIEVFNFEQNDMFINIHTKKAVSFFCALYLVVFFAFVMPFHHHDDGANHTDCSICLILHQTFISSTVIAAVISVSLSFFKIIRLKKIFYSSVPCIFDSRAPPLM